MIKLSQLLIAINKNLKSNFKDIKVDSKDLEERFDRPSFRTSIDGLRTSAFGTTFKERRFTVRVYYFPKDKNNARLEKIKIIEGLEDSFLQSLFITEKFVIPIEELHFEETDGVLVMDFDTVTFERIYNDLDIPLMEELDWKVNNNTN